MFVGVINEANAVIMKLLDFYMLIIAILKFLDAKKLPQSHGSF